MVLITLTGDHSNVFFSVEPTEQRQGRNLQSALLQFLSDNRYAVTCAGDRDIPAVLSLMVHPGDLGNGPIRIFNAAGEELAWSKDDTMVLPWGNYFGTDEQGSHLDLVCWQVWLGRDGRPKVTKSFGTVHARDKESRIREMCQRMGIPDSVASLAFEYVGLTVAA